MSKDLNAVYHARLVKLAQMKEPFNDDKTEEMLGVDGP